MGKLKLSVDTLKGYSTSSKSLMQKVDTLKSKPKNDGSALGYLGARAGIGAAGIFEGIGDFVQGSVYQLMGDKEYAKYLHMNDVTGSWRERLDRNYNPAGVMVFAGDIAEGVGQAIPSLAVGAATGGLGAVAGTVGSVAVGTGYAGRGITDAVKQTGDLGFKENAYGIATGALEGITDKFLGGVQKAGKSMVQATSLAAKAGAKKVARQTLVRGILSSAGSEALEEFIQEYADTALLRLTKVNKEAEFSFSNALYSGLIGGITGGIMGGVSVGVRTGVNYRIGDDIRRRGLEEQLIKTADFVRDEYFGNVKNFDNVTSESLKALTASVDAYRKLNDKSGTQGAVILGEIKRELLAFETSAGVDGIKADMMTASVAQRAALAKSATALYGKTVTAEDIATNKDGVTRRLALESFVHDITTDTPSATDIKRSQINEAVAAERLPYIKQSAGWDGESAVQYREPKSGKYVLVEPSEDGSFRMAYSPTAIYDENNLMFKEGLSGDQVKKTLAGLADGSLEIGENGIGGVNGNQKNTESTNAASKPKRMYDIVVLEDGKTYVKASRNVITGNTLAEKRSQITNFFNSLLGRDTSLDLTTIDGETLTITKDETANKARDNYREENGKRVALTDDEFIVKLHAEAHIDELAETSTKNTKPLVADAKGHNFAKDGFEYKSVYFQDFNGKYYKITLSIGHNGTRATVYNVGRIKEGVLPSAKVIAVRGSIGPWNTPSNSSIPQNPKKSTENAQKDNRKSLAGENPSTDSVGSPPFDKGGKGTEDAQNGSQQGERVESEQEGASEAQEAAKAEIKGINPSTANAVPLPLTREAKGMSERERKRGYSDTEADEARALVAGFDTMSREKRLSIIEMMRSAKATGASKSFMKRAAALIGHWRKGLWIIADDKTSERGFYQGFSDGSRLIVVNPKKKADNGKSAVNTAFVHELSHDIWAKATVKTKDAFYRLATEGASAAEVEDIRNEYKAGYEARGLTLDEETLREEVFANLIAKVLGNERFLERFELTPGRMTAFKRSIKAVTRMAKCFFGKDKYLYSRCEKMARSLIRVMGEQAALEAVSGQNIRFSISETDDNRPVVVVNDDIVRYAANDKELVKLVKKSISKTKYVAINKQKIFFIDDTKNEVTYSEYTKKLRRKSPDVYQDKMRLFNHPSEIILAATNYINEGLSHPRKDDIIDFARGELLIDIQGRKYSAEVVIGFTNKGICELHDIVKIKPASFQYKTRHALRTISSSNEHFQTGAHLVTNSIPQNSEKSTEKAKKSFSLNDKSSARSDEFDANEFLDKAMANGGMVEKPKSQTDVKKADTEERLKVKVDKLKEDNARLEREARTSERKAKNAEKREAATSERMESEKAKEVKRIATSVKKLVNDFSFLVNEATHRKYTAGGAVGATILADPAIQAFAAYFAKRGSAYSIMNKSTRDGVKLLLEFYNPQNPIFTDEIGMAEFFGDGSRNIFSSYRPEVAEMIKSIAEGEGDLSLFELQQLGSVVSNVKHIYENYDAVRRKGKSESAKVMAARGYEVQKAARSVLDGDSDQRPKLKKIFRVIKESYLYTVVTPEEVLRDLENHVKDPVLSELYRDIRLGEAEAGRIRAQILTPITEFLAKKENKEFFENLSKPSLDFCGIKISAAQAVGIYETSKRKHAQQRLFDPDGGIKIYDAEKGERVTISGLTQTSIDNLYGQFDSVTKEYIKHLEAAMSACKKYKVKTDRDVMGFTNAIDGHYYPITTDPNYFAKDITDIRQSMGIEDVVKNKSFNKNTVQGAQAPLVIEDSQRVLERHVFGIAQYSGLYIPLQNFGKVYGAKFDPSIPAENQNVVKDLDKLKEAARVTKKTSLREYYNTKIWAKKDGKGGLDSYLTKLFADIQRIKPGETSIIDRAVEFIRSGYVNSVFGLNPKIIFTQLASYPAAFKVIDADCLARAFGNEPFSKENAEAMDKYSRLTLARQFEGANAADGLIEKLSELGKKTSVGIEFTDRGVILALYSACQLQVAKNGGAEVGTIDNLKEAGALLDNVLLDTQTTSLLSDRSALARDKNEFAKTFSMFKNEAVKAASSFYGAISTYIDHKRFAESDESYGELLEEDKKRLARNLGGYLGSSAVVAAVSIIFAKIRSAGKGEDEKEKLGVMVAEESIEAVFNLLPIISDVAAFMVDGYDIDSLPYEVFNDMLTAIRGVSTVIDPKETREAKAKYLRNTAYTAGKVLGLPVQNTARLATTTVAIFNKPLAYKLNDRFDTTKSYKSDLDRAIASGNLRLAQTITSLWVSDKMTGKASEAVVSELVRLYSAVDEQGNKVFKYPKVVPSSLTSKEKARFMEVYSGADEAVGKLLLSSAYKALDDKGKADAVKAIYNEYYKLAEAKIVE